MTITPDTTTATPPTPDATAFREHYDMVVIGGGINGTAVAREAAGRGLSVLLCQAKDLATGYSSNNPFFLTACLNDLRHLRLAKLASHYRAINQLRHLAPHLLRPINSVEYHPKHWSWPLLDAVHGLWQHPSIPAAPAPWGRPAGLAAKANNGYQVLDFRFTLANALAAKAAGATVATQHRLTEGSRHHGLWQLAIRAPTGRIHRVNTQILINATGAHVQEVIHSQLRRDTRAGIQQLRLSHLVMANTMDLQTAVFYQTTTEHQIGLTPINQHWLHFGPLITQQQGALTQQQIDSDRLALWAELRSLSGNTFAFADIVQCKTGLRAICDDGIKSQLNDLVLDFECPDGQSPLVNLLGGDLLCHAKTAQRVLRLIAPYLPKHSRNRQAGDQPLPGGNIRSVAQLTAELKTSFATLPESLLQRLTSTYGELSYAILGNAKQLKHLGRDFGHGLYQAEVNYLIKEEWAKTAEDILMRRTGLGWDFSEDETQALQQYVA